MVCDKLCNFRIPKHKYFKFFQIKSIQRRNRGVVKTQIFTMNQITLIYADMCRKSIMSKWGTEWVLNKSVSITKAYNFISEFISRVFDTMQSHYWQCIQLVSHLYKLQKNFNNHTIINFYNLNFISQNF